MGDAVTVTVSVRNTSPFDVRLKAADASITFPCELYKKPDFCKPVSMREDINGMQTGSGGSLPDIDLISQGTVSFSAYFSPAGPEKGRLNAWDTVTHSVLFQSKTRYPVSIRLKGTIKGSVPNKEAVTNKGAVKKASKEVATGTLDDFEVVLKNDLTVTMSHVAISFYALLGALLAGGLHMLTRQAFAYRARQKLDMDYARTPFPTPRPRRWPEWAFALMLLLNGAVVAFVLAPLVSMSSGSERLFQARLLDAFGAGAFGFALHFLCYDLGYNKLYPMIMRILRAQGSH